MISEGDKKFLEFIKENEHLGFGRMIQIISYTWYRKLEREYGKGVAEGAFAGTCVASLDKEQKREYFGILKQDEKKGMDY